MLRPATPLSVLLFAAFALLLLSVLSVPVIQGIPLGEFQDATFGVFGFCRGNRCSSISVGYDIETATPSDAGSFDLPSSVRSPLAAILIVHPVAALITLIMFIMAVAAHFHAPAHSSRYLLVLFIFLVIDFLVCLLAFLVDVLVFIPHLAWGSYLVLAATIIVLVSSIVTCAMRRTITGRKSRQKAIAQNAEMSGENYYNREAHVKAAVVASEPSIPAISGANQSVADSLPQFASFEQQRKMDQDSDERIPLTQRSPSNRSNVIPNDVADPAAIPPFNPPSRSGSQDRYGNPANGPQDAYAMGRGPGGPPFDRANSRGRGGMGPPGGYRGGRGGYGRGGYDNYGPPTRGRGGYGPPGPGRGGYGPRGGRGGYGPPPRGYGPGPGGMRGGRSPPPNMPGPYDRRPTGDSYNYNSQPQDSDPALDYGTEPGPNFSLPSTGPAPNGGYEAYNPDTASLPRAESPPPLPYETSDPLVGGRPVEMDASPSPVQAPKNYGQFGPIRDSDIDVAGMVGLQQGKPPMGSHDTYMTEASKYSTDEFVPPRAGWNQGSGRNSPRAPSPLNVQNRAPANERASPAPAAPGGAYYEDIDPRFAAPAAPVPQQSPPPLNVPPPIEPIYEDVHADNSGARSPAESERSNFTSISQRGINPRWNPAPPMPHQQGPPRRPGPQRQDILLDMPDFQIGGPSGKPQRGAGPGMIPGSAYPTGPI
ncbi:SUR7/PalI family-domain-containing protein [Stachybotrys elegans]|uniref:SUR7/PalI family-domain-containing protein n=1 Tax=Stachybotrys elegans TaxID=80388 RepID=A0A8K0SFE4_9HYPO|nr:SUR7/PalI family-domain-containing protein [Stachybotrys elegans]